MTTETPEPVQPVSCHRGRQLVENLQRRLEEAAAEEDEARKQDLLLNAKERSKDLQAVIHASIDAALDRKDLDLCAEWRKILRDSVAALNELRARTLTL